MSIRILIFGLFLATTFPIHAQQTLLLRQPALSESHLAFVYAGDLWIARSDGSQPRRLTSSAAVESHPVFSPDGSMLAMAGRFEGNTDVYVIPVAGGQPKRLTWHSGSDIPQDWSADGKQVAFISARETDHGRSGQLYHVALSGGAPVKQMEARIERGRYGDNGQLAYIPFASGYNGLFGGYAGWKGYRGGTVPAIHLMDADRENVTVVPGEGATNFNPVWLGGAVYFLSDRDQDKDFNIYRYQPANGELDKISNETEFDIRAMAGHGSTLVYENGGRLKQLDLNSGIVTELEISIRPDLPQLRPQWKNAAETITYSHISRSGKRAVITARGEVFTVPIDKGSTRNISNSAGVREYTALWSPDGQSVAWITEHEGGQAVVVADQYGKNARQFPLGEHFYTLASWGGGDQPRLIYTDNHLGLFALDVKSGDFDRIATGARRDQFDVSVSLDGRWLAYTLEQRNYHRDLMLYDFTSGKSTRVSDGMADVASPAFSPDGELLFFAASTNSGPLQVGLNMTSQERPYRAALYAAVLSNEGSSPLLDEAGDELMDENDEKADKEDGDEADEKVVTRIDLKGLSARIVALPVPEQNYGNLQVGKDGDLFYLSSVQPGAAVLPPGGNAAEANHLMRYDFEDKEEKSLLTGVQGFSISDGGEHLLVRKADGSLAAAEISDEMEPKNLDLEGVRLLVDPKQEWTQIFNETWRMEKEYFYAPNMHGLDWDAIREKYRALLPHVGSREELTALLIEMVAELQVGHNYVAGGDTHNEQPVGSGLLGANFEVHNGHYRLSRVYTAEQWNPFLKAPLAVPGNEARVGEYILAINGRELTSRDNLFAYLQGTVGNQVTLRVGPNANGKDSREIVVEPVDSERQIRLWHWIENNRRLVDQATDGRVGYIYLPNTAGAGYTFFNRMFFSQLDKQALIVDERANGGGQAANYIIEVLGRKHLSGWADRDGLVFDTPAGAVHGPKVMLIDQDAGSGGDYLPFTFRSTGIGKLIGTRTWGGLIGIYANPPLIDGGFVAVPFFRFFDAEGNWSVENEGVAPDLEVTLDPIASNRGEDSQLQAGIAEILSQLEDYESPVMMQAPPLPTQPGE